MNVNCLQLPIHYSVIMKRMNWRNPRVFIIYFDYAINNGDLIEIISKFVALRSG